MIRHMSLIKKWNKRKRKKKEITRKKQTSCTSKSFFLPKPKRMKKMKTVTSPSLEANLETFSQVKSLMITSLDSSKWASCPCLTQMRALTNCSR